MITMTTIGTETKAVIRMALGTRPRPRLGSETFNEDSTGTSGIPIADGTKREKSGHGRADQERDESTPFSEGNRENDREYQPYRRSGYRDPVELRNFAEALKCIRERN